MSLDLILMLPPGYGFDASNSAPVITVPGAQSATSNVALAITGTSIADADGNAQALTITTNASGTITLASTTGLTGSGNGTNSLSYSGSLANINTAIATLSYVSATNYEGSETIAINTNDGTVSATQKTISVTVVWNPLSLTSNLAIWLDPSYGTYTDDGVTPAASGDVVKRWVSRNSGSLYLEQATLGNRPSVATGANGKLSIYNSGSKTLATSSGLGSFPAVDTARSIIVGSHRTSAASSAYPLSLGTWNTNNLWALDCGSATNIRIAGNGNNYVTTFTVTNNTWFIVDATYDSTTLSIRKDAATAQTFSPTDFNTSYGSCDVLNAPGQSLYFNGYVSNIIVTKHKLSATELGLLYTFVSNNQPT